MLKQHPFKVDPFSEALYKRPIAKQLRATVLSRLVAIKTPTAVPMSSRLDQFHTLALLAKEARYNVSKLARLCGVSPRQLQRHIEGKYQTSPHKWLHNLRMRRAVELVRDKTPIKEAWIELGYKDSAHFTHDFTHYFGLSPTKFSERQPELHLPVKNVRF